MLLVLLAGLPGIGLIVYNGMEQHRDERLHAHKNALGLANLVSMETEQLIQRSRRLLNSLAQFPAISNRDSRNCAGILENLQVTHPEYTSLAVTNPSGEVLCISHEGGSAMNLADRDYFQRALETREFVVSDLLFSRLTGKPSLAFAYPSIETSGELKAVIIAALDLSQLEVNLYAARLPAGSTLSIIDSKGRILARWPEQGGWIGRDTPETEIVKLVIKQREGVAEAVGMDGVPRLYGFRPLSPDKQTVFVYVGIPRETAYAPVNRILFRNLAALGVVLALALSAAHFFGQVFIMRGVTSLVDTTKQLARGDLSARTDGLSARGDEIGFLAGAFDDMAEVLEQREEERMKTEQEILKNAASAQLQADISDEFIKAGPDFAPALSSVTERVTKWFDDTCFIHLLTEEGEISGDSPVYYSRPERLGAIHTPFSFSERGALALLVEVVRTGDSIMSPIEYTGCIPAEIWEGLQCRSLVIVPMRADEEIMGTLTIIRDRPELPHTAEDESLVQYIADRAAISIAKARLMEMIHRLNAELEQRVKERTAQLMAANKELEAFAYSVSHDLRAPLRAIDGFSRILLEKYDALLDSKGRHYLQRTRSAAQRMGQLIDDLLNLSRLTRKEMQWTRVDLSSLGFEIEAELRESQPGRAVDFLIQDDLVVPGDEHLLRAALENLLENAWKFTGNNHWARIEFGIVMKDDEQVFFVSDNGAGFDMEYADQLFGAFQRLHSMTEYPGTGIGLAIVQRVIHRHGGSIWAEGTVGEGATFYFKLPKGGDF
jgi:signal transduction histidine kinase/HAMP domain-containing protein